MRILELEIREVRGIRKLMLCPQKNNCVISGPNGSGKSGIVDAIDFLLTGRIQRLTGRGTRQLSLKQHGVHVGAKVSEAEVRALVMLHGCKKPIELRRSIAQPEKLHYDETAKDALAPVLNLANTGQYVLSRREILKFITAEAGDRANEIQTILNLTSVERTRQTLVSIRNSLKAAMTRETRNLREVESNVSAAAHLEKYNAQAVLEAIDEQRAILGGEPLDELRFERLLDGLHAPEQSCPRSANPEIVRRDIRSLLDRYNEKATATRSETAIHLINLAQELSEDAELLRSVRQLSLAEEGIKLIDDGGACPLCDREWESGELFQYLSAKIKRAQEGNQAVVKLREYANGMVSEVRTVLATVQTLSKVATSIRSDSVTELLDQWAGNLLRLENYLQDPVQHEDSGTLAWETLARFAVPEGALEALTKLREQVGKDQPQASPMRTAWDLLTRLEEHTKRLVAAQQKETSAQVAHKRADALYRAYEEARDTVLNGLYNQIKDRFVDLYRAIHYADESTFEAKLQPDGAGLAFEVDFHGVGTYPPHALHSEGHQDSMGLCLYLALAEYLNKGVIDIIILDDVVMSVDAGHRREICRLLTEQFPNHQFIITTHERAWAGQLRTEGVVKPENCITFYGWSLAVGPHVEEQGDMWDTVREHLSKDDIPGAAHAMRYGLEAFYRSTCSALKGSVQYNVSERWDLNDFRSASIAKLSKYVREAIAAAKSWGKNDEADRWLEFQSILDQAKAKAEAEQGQVNPNVHYNQWANYSRQELEIVADAMEELTQLFKCSTCGGLFEAQGKGQETTVIRCACGEMTMNLVKMKAPSKQLTAQVFDS